MIKGFWGKLAWPIVGLSPMDGVTDAACRYISKKYGQPDVIYTEFVSAEGLWRIKKRGEMDHKIWNELKYDESERPVVAQLFGSDPDSFYEAAKIVADLGFDGIDINMGCPSPGLEKREGGAGLMRSKERAKEVIEATRRGVEDSGREIPVSVKTRIGSTKPDEEWWKFLASMNLPAVAMHGRTFKQLYSGEADWEVLEKAAEVIRKDGALFLANGDVKKIMMGGGGNNGEVVGDCHATLAMTKGDEEGMDSRLRGNDKDGKWSETCLPAGRLPRYARNDSKVVLNNGEERAINKFDGVLIGRHIIGNPWVLRRDGYEPTIEEKLRVAVEHAKQYELSFPGAKIFPVRKHLVRYASGFDGCVDLRRKLVVAENAVEVETVVNDFLHSMGYKTGG